MLKWHVAAKTDIGCQRQRNEDNFYISADERVFLVADGLGGAVGGALASKLTVEEIANWYRFFTASQESGEWLTRAIATANSVVHEQGESDRSLRGMGSTVVLAWQYTNNKIEIAHVGDSRAYLYRRISEKQSKLTLLTQDHTGPAGVPSQNPYANVLTACLGHEPELKEIGRTMIELGVNDWIILCSDGLPVVLRDEDIIDVLETAADPNQACEALVNRTKDGGAPDNVTVIAIQYYQKNGGGDDTPNAPVPLKPKPREDSTESALSMPSQKQEEA